jgi:hypothetical protein
MSAIKWPTDLHPTLRVCHPVNTQGTVWLRESDLVFVKEQPYAVFHWEHGKAGDLPDQYVELDPKRLTRDRQGDQTYRYEGELQAPDQYLRRFS